MRKNWRGILILLIGIIGLTVGIYYFVQYSRIKDNPDMIQKEEVQRLVSVVGKLIELPEEETPVVATIMDREKLADQDFFKNAQNGDKLLAYTKSMKAILYRPSAKKIINVAPIIINNQEGATDLSESVKEATDE
jgi:hypothetical protein